MTEIQPEDVLADDPRPVCGKYEMPASLPERDAHLTAFAAALTAAEIDRQGG